MSASKWVTAAPVISRKCSGVWSASRQPTSEAHFSFPQDRDRNRRIAREETAAHAMVVSFAGTTIEENDMKNLIMMTTLLTGSVAAMADTSNGADNFYKSDKVTAQKVTF